MPKRNRTKEQRAIGGHAVQSALTPTASAAAPAVVETEASRAARLFAQSVKDHAAADQATQEQADAAAAHARLGAELLAGKDAAAALIRHLRSDGRPRQKMADAEAAYRAALAELTEFETGERPHWAPPSPTADNVDEAPDSAEPEARVGSVSGEPEVQPS